MHRHAFDARVGAVRPDHNRLTRAVRRQCQASGERRGLGHDANMLAVGPSRDRPCNKARRFTPGAGNRACRISGARAQIEVIAVAGATNIELKIPLVAEYVVRCPASDRFALTVRQVDCTGAGPLTCQALKWCYALRVGRICNANCKREKKRRDARRLFQPERWRCSEGRPLNIDKTKAAHTRVPLWNVKALPRVT